MMGPLQQQIHLDCDNVTTGQNRPMHLLPPGSVQTVDTCGLAAVFYLARLTTELTYTIQSSASYYKLLRSLKLLGS